MSTGQAIGAVAGGVAGFFIGGPAGALQGATWGAALGGVLDPPKGPTVEGPRLSDLTWQQSSYGGNIPRVYGTVALAGNVVWLEHNKLKEVVKKNKSGGKGGGGGTTTKVRTYFATFALMLCQGEVAGVRRIWCGDKLIYNAGSDDLETIIASNQAAKGWRLYTGTDDQLPDPRYEADVGVGNAPAFRGYTYIVFNDFALADYSNTLPAAQFKVELYSTPATTPSLIKTISYIGTPVGQADGVMYTAQVTNEYVQGGNYYSEVTFRTYSLATGILVDTNVKGGSIAVQGSSSLTWYTTSPIQNMPGEFAIYRSSGTKEVKFSAGTGFSYFPSSSYAFIYEIYHGYGEYWINSSDGLTSITDAHLVTEFPFTGVFGTMNIRVDEETGRKFIRYQNTLDGFSRFGEFHNDPRYPLWQQQISNSITEAPSNTQAFVVSRGRALVGIAGNARVYQINDSSLTLLGQLSYGAGGRNIYQAGYMVGISTDGIAYQYSDRIGLITVPLAEIIQSECQLSSLIMSSDLDISMIADHINGYRVSGGTIRSVIEPLQGAYPFDVVPSGYKIKFVPRGGSPVITIPWEDLAATDGSDSGDSLPYSREMDSQLPQKVTITALSSTREYASATQSYERLNTSAVNVEQRDIPLVLSDDEVAQMAEKLLFLRWLERDDFSYLLPPTYLALEPADVVTVQAKFGTFELRQTEVNYEADGRLTCKAKANSAPIYTSRAVGAPGPGPDGTVAIPGPSVLVNMDIPMIDESIQNSSGFVSATTGYTEGWPGCVVVRSNDSGQTWAELQAFVGKGTIGKGRGLLTSNSGALVDRSSLIVDLISGELESVTFDQMLNGANIAAYGHDGRWEIIRFQNAVLQSDGSYLLNSFVRGDKGTEWATGQHQAFDWFVLLDDPDNDFLNVPIESLTLDRLYRAVTSGASIDAASDIHFAYRGVNLKPLSPVAACGSRNGSGDLDVSFTRRSRFTSSWWVTGVPTPVGETSESYQADIMSGSAPGSTVKRTISFTTASFNYPGADQVTDFGSLQSAITIRIYQISSTVGRGYPLEVTL